MLVLPDSTVFLRAIAVLLAPGWPGAVKAALCMTCTHPLGFMHVGCARDPEQQLTRMYSGSESDQDMHDWGEVGPKEEGGESAMGVGQQQARMHACAVSEWTTPTVACPMQVRAWIQAHLPLCVRHRVRLNCYL
jgi:hypothetical protein